MQLLLARSDPAIVAARFVNLCAVNNEAPLEPLPSVPALVLPPQFPATLGCFRSLSAPNVLQLLQFYDLPIAGNADARKRKLAVHCHVRLV